MGNPYKKNHLEGEVTLLSFVWNKNNESTKEKELSVELLHTCGMFTATEHKPPFVSLSFSIQS